MSSQREGRLKAEHKMLPVLIEQDLATQDKDPEHPLFKAIKQQVRVMIDEDEPPPEGLLRQLLKKRRVLAIIDGFSEMNEPSRTAALSGITDLPVNAVIITTRADEQLGTLHKTEIKPLRVKGNRLSTFMEAYLTAHKKRDLFEDDEFFEACRRLSLIVGDRDITALLAKLYAEQMIATKEGAADADAPENIPELMLSYLNDLSRGSGPNEPDIREVHRAAKSIAWECLKKTLRPTPARRDDVLSALGGEEKGAPLLKHLEERLRLIQTVGAGRDRVRFALDPLAEYLAGMHLVDVNGEDEEAWRSFLDRLDEKVVENEEIKGFLLATRDCCLARENDLQGLKVFGDEFARRAGISSEEGSRYRTERRIKLLIGRLKYSEAKDRINAAEELGSIGSPAKIAVSDLRTLLKEKDISVRISAGKALGMMGASAKEAVPQLIEALKGSDENVRSEVAEALGQIGSEAAEFVTPLLIKALNDPDGYTRSSVAEVLGIIGEGAKESVPHLIEALRDPDAKVRASSARSLGYVASGMDEVVVQLGQALKDSDAEVRCNAADSLGELTGNKAVAELAAALKDTNSEVRGSAANALRKLGNGAKGALPQLIEALQDADKYVRADAARALGEMGEEAIEAIGRLRYYAAMESFEKGQEYAVEAIEKILEASNKV
jgi:HEAT repeat protein